MTHLLKVLPLAVVMVAGPQIITAIMLTTSTKPRQNSYAFVGGAALATAVATSVFYYVAKALKLKVSSHGSSSSAVGARGGPDPCGNLGLPRSKELGAAQVDENVADRGSQRFFQAGSGAVPGDADRRDDDFHGGDLPCGA
jgi:hypothetical protein